VFRGTPVCRQGHLVVPRKFTSHYNYNHNEINNCLSCFLLCFSFHFLYYSWADRGQTRSTKWNWKVTHLSPPPPTIFKMGLVCRHDSSTTFSECAASVERLRNTGIDQDCILRNPYMPVIHVIFPLISTLYELCS
jgi:hypothetical protein